jgi:SAM-dependent methyltransferase
MQTDNPFELEKVAMQWINSVENEKGLLRDTETYPRLNHWFNSTTKGDVLDIGAGQGIASTKISGYRHYTGVEPSLFLVERARLSMRRVL